MKDVPAPEKCAYVQTEDGYTVELNYGKDGSGTDIVHVPPPDPEAAALNRQQLNGILIRYGYQLAEAEEVREKTAAT